MRTPPILIRCEGSNQPGNLYIVGCSVNCAMCNITQFPLAGGLVPEHQRQDIIAMLRRGDFNDVGRKQP